MCALNDCMSEEEEDCGELDSDDIELYLFKSEIDNSEIENKLTESLIFKISFFTCPISYCILL